MRRKVTFIGFGTIVAVAAVALGIFALTGASEASTSPASPTPAAKTRPSEVAIAIGQLQESGGSYATVDLRAGVRNGAVGGNLRFFAEGQGYYNGGVKTLTCDNGVITATGGGGFVTKEGKRIAVTYEATFDKTTKQSSITVTGRKSGFQYTLAGTLDGMTWCGDPAQAPPNVN